MTEIKAGATDRSIFVFILDTAQTDGTGKTGLAHTDMTVSYARMETDNDATVTDVTSSLNALASLTATHNDWGWREVSSTLAPGLYRLDIADAVFASGAWQAVVNVMITSSLAAPCMREFTIVPQDPYDGVNVNTILGSTPQTAADIATEVYTKADGIETGYSLQSILRVLAAALAGKVTGAGTATVTFRDIKDARNCIVATVDTDGNRSAVTIDLTD